MANVSVHDVYVHDTGGEGFYFGWTGAPPSNLFVMHELLDQPLEFAEHRFRFAPKGRHGADVPAYRNQANSRRAYGGYLCPELVRSTAKLISIYSLRPVPTCGGLAGLFQGWRKRSTATTCVRRSSVIVLMLAPARLVNCDKLSLNLVAYITLMRTVQILCALARL